MPVELAVDDAGEGRAVVLLHGLTATRRYVVMGSRLLERSGHRVVAYDARGHGDSAPASTYDYDALCADLAGVLDARGIERAVLAGASMGAHTVLRFALRHPGRVAAVVVITPGHDPADLDDPARLARWDALAAGLRAGGVEGFLEAYGDPRVPARWRETVLTVIRQRMAAHAHPEAVADALEQVPRSAPFDRVGDLEAIAVPAVVVASRDDADPGHPYALAQAYARALPRARLVSEAPGKSPLAWQGSQVSRVIAQAGAGAAW
jgi:pimeloyl-ACP methyl ester carboxylesterase